MSPRKSLLDYAREHPLEGCKPLVEAFPPPRLLAPCQYCGTLVDGEVFVRLCVPACCSRCAWKPQAAAVFGIVAFVGLMLWAAWTVWRLG